MLAGIRKRLARNFCTISYFFRRSTLSFFGSYFFFDASLARISAAVVGNCKLPALIEPVPLAFADVVLLLLEALFASFAEPFAAILLFAAIVAEGGGVCEVPTISSTLPLTVCLSLSPLPSTSISNSLTSLAIAFIQINEILNERLNGDRVSANWIRKRVFIKKKKKKIIIIIIK
uniref:Uncharacterized protein n=1 Tax=Glossina palpalis gambiensis TaxID=67801 RepID=A0A1B0BEC1_9MUSC